MKKAKEKYKNANAIARTLMGGRKLSDDELEQRGLDLSDPVIYEATELHKPKEGRRLSILVKPFDRYNGESRVAHSLANALCLRLSMGENFACYKVEFSY